MIFDRTRSKIVCTIGPASRSEEILSQMIEAGMDVVRLNMSHADHPVAKETFNRIRSVDDTIPILFDLQGPKIRIGKLKNLSHSIVVKSSSFQQKTSLEINNVYQFPIKISLMM